MANPPLQSSVLAEVPFPTRLSGFLTQARQDLVVTWLGVLVFRDAPEGHLVPTWVGQSSEGEPIPAPDEATYRRLLDDVETARFPGPPQPHRGSVRLDRPAGLPGPASLLLWASPRPVPDGPLRGLASEIAQPLGHYLRAVLADRLFSAVQEHADPVELTDRHARLVYANPAWRRTFGHDPHKRHGDTMASVFRGEDTPHEPAFYQFTMTSILQGNPWLGALDCRTEDGGRRMAEVHVAPFDSPGFLGNLAIRRSLAHREGRERALAVMHHEFRRILASLPDGVVVMRDSRVYFANRTFLDMVGREEAHVIGHAYEHFVHSEDRDALALAASEGRIVRVRVTRPDGRPRIAEISVAGAVSFEGHPATILVSRDLTDDRMAAEMLARAERLSALGSLAAGLAHEINNPLAYLVLNLHNFRQDHGPHLTPAAATTLAEAIDGAERIARIVTDLRNFSGSDPAVESEILEIVDVTSAITSALNIANNELRHRAMVNRSLTPGARVLAREGPLVQVFVSLLVNAAQAIPEGDARQNRINIGSDIRDGTIVVHVSDSGVGIPTNELDRVFDPFFTSKPRTEGSGLGLSIARRIIEGFDGTIEIASTVRVGTTVTITLPHIGDVPIRPTEAPAPSIGPTRCARILVVDDEPQIVRALGRVLRAHEVVTAHSWDEAVQALDEANEFEVVLCDLMMPGQSGPELFHHAVAARPSLSTRFLFMTGGAFADSILDFLKTWRLPVLQKPFDPKELLVLIQKVANGQFDRAEEE